MSLSTDQILACIAEIRASHLFSELSVILEGRTIQPVKRPEVNGKIVTFEGTGNRRMSTSVIPLVKIMDINILTS